MQSTLTRKVHSWYFFCLLFFINASFCKAQLSRHAAIALLQRVIPNHVDHFIIEELSDTVDKDIFEIESRGDKIILRGNNGVSIASGLYYYLNEYAHCQVTWNGSNMNLPPVLPVVPAKIQRRSPYKYRYYMNYCTFSYTMSWWNWERWEKEIDWMALHGINMPLAITGQEYVWQEVYKQMGFSDDDLRQFFSGPAYFAWFWMGNLDAWGGPLPQSWIQSHKDLQQKILARERELGMKPVLPAFTGHVPPSFQRHFPQVKLKQTNWGNGFNDTYILDSEDPMFAAIGKQFLLAQQRVYSTDHFYSADTFNENEPPSDDPVYLGGLSQRVYEAMRSADTDAVWVMQGWLFYSDRKFWKTPQVKALLNAVPNNNMIILDLATEIEPIWKSTEAFYGKPWIWNMLHNFGGNTSLFGRMETIAIAPAEALRDSTSKNMHGIGLTMEAIEQNPVLYELMTAHTWREDKIQLDSWLPEYLHNRYGTKNQNAIDAWTILRNTAYNGKEIRDGAESIIVARPTFEGGRRWAQTKLNYNAADLLPAWDAMMKALPVCKDSEGFQYDIVDITRQVLANYAQPLHTRIAVAYQKKDLKAFTHYSSLFLQLIDDLDKLLSTRKDFMLGPWIASARSCGTTQAEQNLYERNARNLITLWGGTDSRLHEYSCRQWSGLMSDFYKPRWENFFDQAMIALKAGKAMDNKAFDRTIRAWEWQWVNTQKAYPNEPSGSALNAARKIYDTYRENIGKTYTSN